MSHNSKQAGGWRVIVAYSLVCAATQVLWLTYAAITTETARHYGVSVGAVGWLAEIFPLLYVVLAIPAGILLDRWFRPALTGGGALVALGGLVRLGGETFVWAMAGQVIVAVAQPVVLSGVSKLAGEYLPAEQRASGIAVGSAGSFVGMLLALVLGPTVGAHGQIERLLVLEAVLAVIPAVGLAIVLRRPGRESQEHAAIEGSAARALWALPSMRTLCGLVFIGFGIFVALATWLQTLLAPAGVSEKTAGALLVGMVLAGTIACAVLPPLVAGRNAERGFMRSAVLIGCGGCVVLGGGAGARDRGDRDRPAAGAADHPHSGRATRRRRRGDGRRDRVDGGQPRRSGRGATRAGPRSPSAGGVPGDGRCGAARVAARGPPELAVCAGARRWDGGARGCRLSSAGAPV